MKGRNDSVFNLLGGKYCSVMMTCSPIVFYAVKISASTNKKMRGKLIPLINRMKIKFS